MMQLGTLMERKSQENSKQKEDRSSDDDILLTEYVEQAQKTT